MNERIDLPGGLFYSLGYVMLPHEITIAPTVKVGETIYYAKKEFHISIIAIKNYAPVLAEKLGITSEEATTQILEEVKTQLSSFPISFKDYTNDVRVVFREDRSSIIIFVEVVGIKELYDHLKSKFEMEFYPQPTHITLYTLENGKGIGLNSSREVEKLTRKLDSKDVDTILKAIHLQEI